MLINLNVRLFIIKRDRGKIQSKRQRQTRNEMQKHSAQTTNHRWNQLNQHVQMNISKTVTISKTHSNQSVKSRTQRKHIDSTT